MNNIAPPLATAPLPAATYAAAPAKPDPARETAEAFESFFIQQFLQSMFSGIRTDGAFGGGSSEGAYRSLLHEQYAKAIAGQGGFGIADTVHREILRMQEQGA